MNAQSEADPMGPVAYKSIEIGELMKPLLQLYQKVNAIPKPIPPKIKKHNTTTSDGNSTSTNNNSTDSDNQKEGETKLDADAGGSMFINRIQISCLMNVATLVENMD